MTELLDRLLSGGHLGEDEALDLVSALAREDGCPAQSGALLAALRAKGETPEEVRGLARGLRKLARGTLCRVEGPSVDVVGTGGDGSGSYNLSTGSALLAAALGHRVIKHGNRSITSRSGSADVLEALGLPMPLDDADARRLLDACGFTFLFAPAYHPAMKAIADVRRRLGVRTVFNILGPLVNPAAPSHHLIGAFSKESARLIAEALAGMPIERAFVVHGHPGWDEATPCGPFHLFEVTRGRVVASLRTPEDYGMSRCEPAALAGGDAAQNARAMEVVLRGVVRDAHRHALVLGAALVDELMGASRGPREACERVEAAIEDGRAGAVLDALDGAGASARAGMPHAGVRAGQVQPARGEEDARERGEEAQSA